ncbi:MAG: hypothetical protein IT482_04500 [Gammaproteobacteria bacterium]|nr:hypothetical protein [Gammaproteobacteria bacterium]
MDCSTLVPVPSAEVFRSSMAVTLESVNYSPKDLTIRLQGPDGIVEATFVGALGYRVLDERDMAFGMDFLISEHWLFEVREGGWLAEEVSRSGFISHQTFNLVVEYLVITQSECISVLVDHRDPPAVTLVRSNPSLERP